MAKILKHATMQFPEVFKPLNKWPVTSWFPGHMFAGMKAMQAKIRNIDCVIEVHDARIPFTGRNKNFAQLIPEDKPRILVFNKSDLSGYKQRHKVKEVIQQKEQVHDIFFTECKSGICPNVRKIIPAVQNAISSSFKYHRSEAQENALMVIGIPNVGKSSIINALRHAKIKKGNAAITGAGAGVTRSVMERIKVCDVPPIYLLDTPGILEPHIDSMENGLKLALCAIFPDKTVSPLLTADYLLFHLNRTKNFRYIDIFQLERPYTNINEFLIQAALQNNKKFRVKDLPSNTTVYKPDIVTVAFQFVQLYQNGMLGKGIIDDLS